MARVRKATLKRRLETEREEKPVHSATLTVRLLPDDRARVEQLAKRHELPVTSLARALLLAALDDAEVAI